MFDFLITCRIYGNFILISVYILRLYFVEKIPALSTQKRVNKAIHPQSPIKYAREVNIFLPMVFQMIPPVQVKTCAWNSLLAGEFMTLIPSTTVFKTLIPSTTVSRFATTHICTVFLSVLRYTAIWQTVTHHTDVWLFKVTHAVA